MTATPHTKEHSAQAIAGARVGPGRRARGSRPVVELHRRRAAWFKRRGDQLRSARVGNRPELDADDLKLLGVERAPSRLSQGDLALLCGCSRSLVSRIENGEGFGDAYLYALLLWLVSPAAKRGVRP